MRLICQESERCVPNTARQVAITALRQQIAPIPRATDTTQTTLAAAIGLTHHAFPAHSLSRGTLHEFLTATPIPAITLLTQLAQAIATTDVHARPLLWIGPCLWPYLPTLPTSLLSQSLFLRPQTVAERLWAIDLAIRSQSISGIIADGSALDLAATRRLFLSTQSTSITCIIARPPHERHTLTAAATRWLIAPHPSPQHTRRWSLQLLRCKSHLAASTNPTDRTWIIEHAHQHSANSQTGHLRVVTELFDRSGVATPAPRRINRIVNHANHG